MDGQDAQNSHLIITLVILG